MHCSLLLPLFLHASYRSHNRYQSCRRPINLIGQSGNLEVSQDNIAWYPPSKEALWARAVRGLSCTSSSLHLSERDSIAPCASRTWTYLPTSSLRNRIVYSGVGWKGFRRGCERSHSGARTRSSPSCHPHQCVGTFPGNRRTDRAVF